MSTSYRKKPQVVDPSDYIQDSNYKSPGNSINEIESDSKKTRNIRDLKGNSNVQASK